MSYIMSEMIKKRIQCIPSFGTDVGKIKSVSTVKRNYGIDSDETIISFRVVPQLFAKLEKGGAVFTDKGVYKRLPSGYLSSDFVTYGIKYEDMVEYIPYLGYSKKQQPQLVGEYTGKDTLSFWMTPVIGAESNTEIVSIFSAIIQEVIMQNESLSKTYEETKTKCLTCLENKFEAEGNIPSKDEDILKILVESNQFRNNQKEDAVFLLFEIRFVNEDYLTAYDLVEKNSDYMQDTSFVERIDPIIRNKIESIGIPETYTGVEALKLYCIKNNTYLSLAFPNIVSYYYKNDEYDSANEFMEKFKDTLFYENMETVLKTKIEEIFSQKVDDWSQSINVDSDEKFILYAMKNPAFYKRASRELVKHYCVLEQFEDAQESLEKVRSVEDNEEFLEELQELIKEYKVTYAADQYKQAQEYIKDGNKKTAAPYLFEAVKCDFRNQEYILCFIQIEFELKEYSTVKSFIELCKRVDYEFDEDGFQKIHNLELSCAENMNREMGALYDLLVNGNDDSLNKDPRVLGKVDQLGLSFYHYAILLQNEEVVARIDVSGTPVCEAVCDFELLTFGAATRIVSPTFLELLKLYDDDGKKLYKDYKWRKKEEEIVETGRKIFGMLTDSAMAAADRADSRLMQMEKDKRLSDEQREKVANKRREIQEQMENMTYNSGEETEYDVEDVFNSDTDNSSGDILYDEYISKLKRVASEKIIIFANKLEENVVNADFKSKLIYMIIKNPKLLEKIFHGDSDDFVLYETQNSFWYLPQSLITEVNELII